MVSTKTTINWSNGTHETFGSLDEARAAVLAKYPQAFFYHDGGRWLAWRNEAESENDDGSNAIAEFVV